jgi:hypothetical protein
MKRLWNREPVLTAQFAGGLVAVAAVFGLELTLEQGTAIVSLIGLVVSLIARSQVIPVK